MPTPVQCIPVLEQIAPGLPYGNDVFLDDVLAQMVAAGTDEPLPVADFTIASKVALTGGLYALASSETDAANGPLTYAWFCPSPAVAFLAPTAAYTAFTATTPGQYDITLTVTDAAGHTAQQEQRIVVDRVLYVGGTEQSAFTALQNAFNWINANDVANAASYVIEVYGATADGVRIVPNAARVKLMNGATIPVGVDFPAGTYHWSGNSLTHATDGITCAAGHTITLTTGTVLQLSMMLLTNNNPAGSAIFGTAGSALVLRYLSFSGSGAYAVNVTGVGLVVATNCQFSLPVSITNATNVSSRLLSNQFTVTAAGRDVVTLTTFVGAIVANYFYSGGAGAAASHLLSVEVPAAGAGTLTIANNTLFVYTTAGAGQVAGIKVRSGAGVGYLRIADNSIQARTATGVGLHLVGTFPANLLIANNVIEGAQNAVLSTTDSAGAVPLAQVNAPFYGNVLRGVIANVTFAAAAALNGGNVQV